MADEDARELWGKSRKNRWSRRESMDRDRLASVFRTEATLAKADPKRNKAATARHASSLRSLARGRLSIEAQSAASDIITYWVVDALSRPEHSDTVTRVQHTLEVLGASLTADLESTGFADWLDASYRSGFANSHVWCTILNAASNFPDSDPSRVLDSASRLDVHALQMDDAVRDSAARSIRNLRAATIGHSDLSQQVLQISSLFICPAPEAHSAMVETGLAAIVNSMLPGSPDVKLALEFLLTRRRL